MLARRGDLLQLDVMGANRILLCLLVSAARSLDSSGVYMARRANAVSMLTYEGYKIYGEWIPLFMSGCESLGTIYRDGRAGMHPVAGKSQLGIVAA